MKLVLPALVALTACMPVATEIDADSALPSPSSFVRVRHLDTGWQCMATLVAPRVALTATSCVGDATADRLVVESPQNPWALTPVEWRYHRGTSAEPFTGARLEDVDALLLAWPMPGPALPMGTAHESDPLLTTNAEGEIFALGPGARVLSDRITFDACDLSIANGDPILQNDAVVAIVSRRDGSCQAQATTVVGRGPVESALSKAEGHRGRVQQTHHVHDGLIDATTQVIVLASPERALAALEDSWGRWWPDGRVTNHARSDAGVVSFELSPVSGLPVHVSVSMAPAVSSPRRITSNVTLSGSFVGTGARFEIEDIGTPDEPRVAVRSIWDDIAPTGAFGWAAGPTAQLHMWAEGGKLPGKRTGLPGLIDHLERWQDLLVR